MKIQVAFLQATNSLLKGRDFEFRKQMVKQSWELMS